MNDPQLTATTWKEGPIQDCPIQPLRRYTDSRGWLAELFRFDELPANLHPVMAYLSMTHPGVARGPHEHLHQTDLFVFFDGLFRLYLWDTRPDSSTYGYRQTIDLGGDHRATVFVPPGVVHAYRNIGDRDALILNCPNQLYAGEGKKEAVDEIRHEDLTDSPFLLD